MSRSIGWLGVIALLGLLGGCAGMEGGGFAPLQFGIGGDPYGGFPGGGFGDDFGGGPGMYGQDFGGFGGFGYGGFRGGDDDDD